MVLMDGKATKENSSQKLAEASEIMKEVKKITASPIKMMKTLHNAALHRMRHSDRPAPVGLGVRL